MASAPDFRRFPAALGAVILTAALVWFGNGLNPWWPLLWFAPLPVLLFATRSSWRSAALVAFFGWLLGSLNMWHYLHVLGLPALVWFTVFGSTALVFAAAVLLFRALLLRGTIWSAVFSFPAAWVCFEYLNNLTSVHGTGANLAYAQLRFLPFLQVASIAGPWGMSFLMLLFPATVATWLHLRSTDSKRASRVVSVGLGIIVVALVFGALRVALPVPGPRVKVGLIASDESANVDVVAPSADAERLFGDYAEQAEKLAAQGAQIIVLPEKLALVSDFSVAKTNFTFQSLADRIKATIVVGVVRLSPPLKYNEARIYAPGSPVLSYHKHHMLPPFESNLTPGTTLTILPQPSQTWGVAICKDMDFTPLARQYGQLGAGLMLVPGWDFGLDGAWHGHMAIMRGVEDGFSIVRAAKDGYLTVSDDRGRIVAETRSDSAPFATLLADVPATHQATLYLLLGDWFGWVAIGIFLLTLTRLWGRRNQAGRLGS